jgi:hypothetical protein
VTKVNVIGRIDGGPRRLSSVPDGDTIMVEAA